MRQNSKNYGYACGLLYFYNTLGAVLSAIVITYVGLKFLPIQSLMQILICIFLASALIFWFLDGCSRRGTGCALAFIALLVLCWPDWNRRHHEVGLFRVRAATGLHFKNFMLQDAQKPSRRELVVLDDGPQSTISIVRYKNRAHQGGMHQNEGPQKEAHQNKLPQQGVPKNVDVVKFKDHVLPGFGYLDQSIVVNGKSDGNSFRDFLTTYLLALLPYMYTPETKMNVAVVGFGTGTTAGALGRFDKVHSVKVLEISQALIRHHRLFDAVNFGFSSNKKTHIIQQDAFRFLTRANEMFDIVVSEPSNPWVMGVENLFSHDFYKIMRSKLSSRGTYAQWFHSYSMNNELFEQTVRTLADVFEYVQVFAFRGDIILLASKTSFKSLASLSEAKMNEPFVQAVNRQIGVSHPDNFQNILLLNSRQSRYLALKPGPIHTLQNPRLAYAANKAFFLGETIQIDKIMQAPWLRLFQSSVSLGSVLDEGAPIGGRREPAGVALCDPMPPLPTMCELYKLRMVHTKNYRKPTSIKGALGSYNFLRNRNFIKKDKLFLRRAARQIVSKDAPQPKTNALALRQMFLDGFFAEAESFLNQLVSKKFLSSDEHAHWIKKMNDFKHLQLKTQRQFNASKPTARWGPVPTNRSYMCYIKFTKMIAGPREQELCANT